MSKLSSILTPEIRNKIKELEIQTRRLLRGSQAGDARSAQKGTGFEFDQIREYQLGDDIRFIDWHASARMNTILVKQYIEERSRSIIIALDISASSNIGSTANFKRDTLAQIASTLALVATFGKDRAGLILFSDEIEHYIPPSLGMQHTQKIMQESFIFQPRKKRTNLSILFKKLASLKLRDMVCFIISDFIDSQLDAHYLRSVCNRYDVTGIRCLDTWEKDLPAIGFVPMIDQETGEFLYMDLRNKETATTFLHERKLHQDQFLKRNGMQIIDVQNNHAFIGDLVKYFRRQMHY